MSNLRRIRLGLAVTASLAVLSGSALAQTTGTGLNVGATGGNTLEITGNSPQACVISAPSQSAVTNASLSAGPNSAQVTVTNLVDPTTSVPLAATIALSFPVICNAAHNLTISTRQGALVLQTAAPPPGPGFRNRLSYQVSATWAGQQMSGTSDSLVPVRITTTDAEAGQLAISIQIPGGGDPLEAGTYSDSLVVNLQPAS